MESKIRSLDTVCIFSCEEAALDVLREGSRSQQNLLIVMHLLIPSPLTSVSALLNLCPSISGAVTPVNLYVGTEHYIMINNVKGRNIT